MRRGARRDSARRAHRLGEHLRGDAPDALVEVLCLVEGEANVAYLELHAGLEHHALNAVRATAIVEGAVDSATGVAGQLYDASADLVQVGTAAQQAAAKAALQTASGWYLRLSAGEKVVSGSTTLSGSVIFGTNTPATTVANSCTANLGEARLYMVSYLDGSATFDINQNGSMTLVDRYQVRAGGGYPPTPIPISVRIGGKSYQAAISGTKVITPPSPGLNRRYRTYWHRAID